MTTPPPPGPQMPPPAGPPPMPPAPMHKKKKNPILIGCLALVALGFLGFVGCVAVVGTAAHKVAKATPPVAAPKVDGGGGKKPRAASIGDPVKDGKFTFTVTKVVPGPHRIGDEYVGKTAQGKFEYVHVTVVNHSTEAQTFAGDDQKLISGGSEYSADTEAAIYLDESKSLWEQINPGNTVKGIIIFDIPKGVKPTAIVLHDSAFSNGVRVALK